MCSLQVLWGHAYSLWLLCGHTQSTSYVPYKGVATQVGQMRLGIRETSREKRWSLLSSVSKRNPRIQRLTHMSICPKPPHTRILYLVHIQLIQLEIANNLETPRQHSVGGISRGNACSFLQMAALLFSLVQTLTSCGFPR